jgi:zinc-binding in reverse transcriptase
MHNTGVLSSYHHLLWKIRAPYKVKIFYWLLLQNGLLTQEKLHHRGMIMQPKCHLCGCTVLETGDHLFSQCRIAISFWQVMRSNPNMPPVSLANSVQETWLGLREFTTDSTKHIWDTACLAICWKERNGRIFRAESTPLWALVQKTVEEIQQWLKYCK